MTRLYAYVAALAIALTMFGGAYWWARHEGAKAEHVKTVVAVEAAAGATEAVRQLDHYTNTVTLIRDRADVATQSVQSAPGASQPLPDGVGDQFRAALAGMRDRGSTASPDHP